MTLLLNGHGIAGMMPDYLSIFISHWLDLILAVAVIVASLEPTLVRIVRRQFDIFEPTFAAGVMLCVIFGVRPIYIIAQRQYGYLGYDVEPQLTATIGLALAGVLSFDIAYEVIGPWLWKKLSGRHRPGTQPRQWIATGAIRRSGWLIGAATSALGLFLFTMYLRQLGPLDEALSLWLGGHSAELSARSAGTTEYFYSAPVLLACAAIAIGVLSLWRLNRLQQGVVAALILVATAIFTINGDRRFLLPCLLVPVVALCIQTSRRPSARLLAVAIPVGFILLATAPWLRTADARAQFGGIPSILTNVFSHPLLAWDTFITKDDTDMESALSVEIQILREPEDFYFGRATIGDLLIAPIPSSVFHDKPVTARNDFLTRAWGGPCAPGYFCSDFSVIGTFYQDLWWPGVGIGMVFLGLLSNLLWVWWQRNSTSPYRVVAAASWTVMLPILIRAGFMPPFAWWLYFLIPTVVIVFAASAAGRLRAHHLPGRRTLAEESGS